MTNLAFRAIQHARSIRCTLAAAPLHRGRVLRGWTIGRYRLPEKAR